MAVSTLETSLVELAESVNPEFNLMTQFTDVRDNISELLRVSEGAFEGERL